MWAASRGDLDIVKFVLDHGGSVETRNKVRLSQSSDL